MVRLGRLREIRERRILTQQELAELAGVSRGTIIRLEAGADAPYPSTIRKLAAALGVAPQALIEDTETHDTQEAA